MQKGNLAEVRLFVRVPLKVKKRIQVLARKQKVSVAEIIRRALEKYEV